MQDSNHYFHSLFLQSYQSNQGKNNPTSAYIISGIFPPHRQIHNLCIALYDLHQLGGYIGIQVVLGHRSPLQVVPHGDRHIQSLGDILRRDAPHHDGAFVQDLGSFCARSDEYSCEVEHRRFLTQCATIGEHTVGVHLQLVVVKETEGLEASDMRVKHEVPLLDELPAPRMGAVDDRHLVLFCYIIKGGH